jgi:hypothetical protein
MYRKSQMASKRLDFEAAWPGSRAKAELRAAAAAVIEDGGTKLRYAADGVNRAATRQRRADA